MIDGDTAVSRNPRAAFRKLGEGGGGVILHLDTAEYHGVNEIGSLVWSLLEAGQRTFDSLVESLRADIENPPEDLSKDISEFLEGLQQRDLVVLGKPGSK